MLQGMVIASSYFVGKCDRSGRRNYLNASNLKVTTMRRWGEAVLVTANQLEVGRAMEEIKSGGWLRKASNTRFFI